MKLLPLTLISSLLLCVTIVPVLQANTTTGTSNPALWVIADDDTTITLFGTMHVMRQGVHWFHGDVKQAFDDADVLVLESLPKDPADEQAIVFEMAVDTSGNTLRSKLDDSERIRYDRAMQTLGLRTNAFDAFEPWMASITLSFIPMMQAGFNRELGVDTVLEQAAVANAKPIVGLETFRQQLSFMDSMEEPLQLSMLNSTVNEIHTIRSNMSEIEALWSSGRIDELGQTMETMMTGNGQETEFLRQFNDTLLIKRNHAWSQWIDQRMNKPGNVFIAVGAAHLAGEGSVRTILESKGYVVQRVGAQTALSE